MTKSDRVVKANALVAAIAGCGRHFFRHGDRLARMEVDARGRVWWVDDYSQRRIYTHDNGRWNGFSHGGTLRSLVQALRDYVMRGEQLRGHLGPWPSWTCNGDLWGYGAEAMATVRAAAIEHGLLPAPKASGTLSGAPAESAAPESSGQDQT